MIAQIIIMQNSRSVDRAFDYLVPAHLEDQISVGMRVIVPFGRSDKLKEGTVWGLADESSRGKLKEIQSVSGARALFDHKGIELVEWMREKYLCTYTDAIRLITPTGTDTRFEEWVFLTPQGEEKKDTIAGAVRKKILTLLSEEGIGIEINRLLTLLDKNVRPILSDLKKEGLIDMMQTDSRQIKDKTVRMVQLVEDFDDVAEVIARMEKASPKQAMMLDILSGNPALTVADLVSFANAGYNAVNALHKKGYIEFFDITLRRDPLLGEKPEPTVAPQPTAEQKTAMEALDKGLDNGEFDTFLIHGVTGSGKTEIFLRLIAKVIASGGQAIVLVPEIALTPQMTARFTARFGSRTAILHSALSLGERYDEWKRIADGEVDVVVGARSAVFAPLTNIKAIILDEEHETTYKSELSPRYHARQVAEYRARQCGGLLVLASATPSLESMYRAKIGSYKLITLKERFNQNAMPVTQVVDMRKELEEGNRSMLSRKLQEEIGQNLEDGKQTILFLNRRGFSTFVSCRSCGYVAKCEHCSISLTYHRFSNTLRCHYCGHQRANYKICPECDSKYIKYFGAGTQRLEEELVNTFEGITVLRMDADTTTGKSSHQRILDAFDREKIDVLIGTQMVAKGLDFPNVTLVGVVAADISLNIDDFRSAERAFALITQVTGRAGRGDALGRAVIQTYMPEHSAVQLAQAHDYDGFYAEELPMRNALWYPPFSELIVILLSGTVENMVSAMMRDIAKLIRKRVEEGDFGRVELLGPAAANIVKVKDKYRWHLLVKCEEADRLNPILKEVLTVYTSHPNAKRLALVIDKNANNFA